MARVLGVFRAVRTAAVLAAASLALTGLCACGGGGGSSADAVVRVGRDPITEASLSQWMSILAGGDFYELSHLTIPKGMVSDPLDYARCTADLKTLAPKLNAKQLRSKCLVLHQALELQALGYLMAAKQELAEDAEFGVTVTGGEVQRAFKSVKAEQFPTEAELREYLAERDWPLSVELFIIKRDLLSEKARGKLGEKFHNESAADAYLNGLKQKWIARTSCSAGYVVLHCAEYKPGTPESTIPPPANLIKEVAAAHPVAPGPPPARDLNCYNKGKSVVCERAQ